MRERDETKGKRLGAGGEAGNLQRRCNRPAEASDGGKLRRDLGAVLGHGRRRNKEKSVEEGLGNLYRVDPVSWGQESIDSTSLRFGELQCS